jgi:hypothetical protein
MKKEILLLLICFFISKFNSTSQIINYDFSIDFGSYRIAVLETSINEIKNYFQKDSIIEVEFDKIYILKDNRLFISVWDKNDDGIIDGIDVENKTVKTWNNISIGTTYEELIKKVKIDKVLIDYDNADKIVGLINNDNPKITMGFYFSGDFDVSKSDESEQSLFKMLKMNPKVVLISIWNPE